MRELKYLFTGAGRYETGYISQVMRGIGVPTGHEDIFNTWGCGQAIEDHMLANPHLVADASWEAAYCLGHECLSNASIIHVVRHPRRILESWLSFVDAGDQLFQKNAVPEMMNFETRVERLIYFCVKWNKIIEGKAHIRYRIEDDVEELLDQLELPYNPDTLLRDRDNERVTISSFDIPDAMMPVVLRWCEHYGYDWDDPPPRDGEPEPRPPTVNVIVNPVIKVVITTLDNLPLLKEQVRILQADSLIKEIVVVNNGSKDGTKEWLDDQMQITTVHRENLGAGPGRNAGLDAAGEFDYVLMLDGGIRPLINGVGIMLDYLDRHLEVDVISPEIATCFTTDLEEAHRRLVEIDESTCFPQRALSSTAYALCRARAWHNIRFCEEGPFSQPGWGVDDNEMQLHWNHEGILHHDFAGTLLYRRASGSFQRLFQETGIWPNQYGSAYEQRNVWCQQNWPQYFDLLWRATNIQVSVVMLGWNEYPVFPQAIKAIHEDLKEIPHEIIFVNNGSTDETANWLDNHALRWHHGNTTVDKDGNILRRNEENEAMWTGNVVRVDLPENKGAGYGYRKGLEKIRTNKYIFLTDGDIIPAPGSVSGLYHYLESHPELPFICANPWFQQDNIESVEEVKFNGYDHDEVECHALGNYGYGFSMFKREIAEAARHPAFGPFLGPGCGYDDVEFVNQMYSAGYAGYVLNTPAYYHKRRDLQRTGRPEAERMKNINERKSFLNVRWPDQGYGIVYHNPMPPEKHIRKVAVLGYGCDNPSDITSELSGNLAGICEVDCLDLGSHIPIRGREDEVTPLEGYDNYILVAGGNWDRWEVPDWCHPAIYWAIDMYYPDGKHRWPQAEPIIQLERAASADKVYCAHKNAVEYYKDNGIAAEWLPACADPLHEYPVNSERSLDWTALWHHCGQRIEYVDYIKKFFPNGFCCFKFREEWTNWVNRGKCSLNVSRLGELNFRPFEVMAVGIPLLTSRVVEIDDFFKENEHYLGISTPEEAVEQIRWVLEHEEEAQEMADRAYDLVLSEHTFYHRILTMLG